MAGAAVLVGLLSGWVAIDGTGTITPLRIQISLAAVPMRSYPGAATAPSGPASMFLTISNPGHTAGRAAVGPQPGSAPHRAETQQRAARSGHGGHGAEDPGADHLTLTPFGNDVVLEDPRPFENDTTVPLTLTFRHAAQITVDANVSAPGTP